MILNRIGLFLFSLLFTPLIAFAAGVSSETSLGSGTFTQEIQYSGSGADQKSPWLYDVSYSYSASEVGSTSRSSRGTGQVDHTHSFSLGVGYEGENSQGGNLSYSTTPEELLSILGAGIYFGHRYALSNEDSAFVPSLKITLSGDLSKYTQSFSRGARGGRKTRPTSGSEGIIQSAVGLSGTLRVWEWSSFKLSGTRYFYDKDVSQFLTQLDQARAISTQMSNFSSTLNGFSREELELGWNFFLPKDFSLNLIYNLSHTEAAGLATKGYYAKISHAWETIDIGASYFVSSSSSNIQNLIGFSADYSF